MLTRRHLFSYSRHINETFSMDLMMNRCVWNFDGRKKSFSKDLHLFWTESISHDDRGRHNPWPLYYWAVPLLDYLFTFAFQCLNTLLLSIIFIGPWVYPKGSLVIALVRVCVCPCVCVSVCPSLKSSETAH